jgi:hypothetical protein
VIEDARELALASPEMIEWLQNNYVDRTHAARVFNNEARAWFMQEINARAAKPTEHSE